jgi:hypothetical protein
VLDSYEHVLRNGVERAEQDSALPDPKRDVARMTPRAPGSGPVVGPMRL